VSMSQASGNVILGDGTAKLSIKGVARKKCKIGDPILFVDGVRYVPDLSESIYSLFLHIKLPDHSVQSSSDKGLFINFPEFKSLAIIGESDIYLDATPMGDPSVTSLIDDTSKSPPSSSTMTSTDAICNHTIQDQSNIINKQNHPENILKSLRQYYIEIQTKRKLNMNLPAGFRQDSTIQCNYKEILPPYTSSKPVPTSDDFHLLSTFSESLPDDTEVDLTSTEPPTPVTNESSSAPVPILRCVDKPSTTLPSRLTFTEDYIRASMGFRRVETIRRHLKSLYGLTVILDSCPPDAVLDAGDFATLHKSPRNTTPVVRPTSFGDVIHMDIIFGPAISLGNIHYGLLFMDRYSHMT